MLEPCDDLDLAEEAVHADGLGELAPQQLERDVAAEDPVVRQEHVGHAAAARQGPQLVPVINEALAHRPDYTAPEASPRGAAGIPRM